MMDHLLSIGSWQFDFSQWWLAPAAGLLILALPLVIVACWRRLFARNPARAALVIALNIVAFTVLLGLLTEPRREYLTSQNIVLISEGIDPKNVPDRDASDVYIAPDALVASSNHAGLSSANWLLDMGQLVLREPALSSVQLLGFGLDESQWQSIPANVEITFNAPLLQGFSHMRWPQTLLMGQTVTVEGRFSGPDADSIIELRLLDPAGQQINQQRIKSGENFSLLVRPKSQGNNLYRLQAWKKNTLLSDQPVTVSVAVAAPLKIMVKQSAPSFETRQLKDFAATTATEIQIYTQTSKHHSITQMVNQATAADKTFSPVSLAASDWLIMDGRALTDLPDMQRQWVYEAVQSGLGLLVLADESLNKAFDKLAGNLLQDFTLSTDNDADDEVIPQLANASGFTNELSLPAYPLILNARSSQAPLNTIISDQNGRPLLASQNLGLGKVAVSLISQSYRWVTAGHRTTWSNYWAAISASLSRQQPETVLIPSADNEFHQVNQRAQICAYGGQKGLSVRFIGRHKTDAQNTTVQNTSDHPVSGDAFELPLAADSLGSARQCGWYWPTSAGWQQVQLILAENGQVLDSQSQYVWGTEQWASQKRYERISATFDRLAQQQTGDQSVTEKLVKEPLNTFWLWLLFIISASALWLERKLDWDAP